LKTRAQRGAAIRVRPATIRDVPTIVRLVRGLAEYERLSHQIRTNARGLRQHGFGRKRFFESLICEVGEKPVGFALYYFAYSTFMCKPNLFLEDVFVAPEERGKGAGKTLLKAVARAALKNGCGGMEWIVLDWNKPAIRFYRKLGARQLPQWILTHLDEAPMRKLARRR